MSSIGKLMNPIPNFNHLLNPVQVYKDVKHNPIYAVAPPGSKGAANQIVDTGRSVSGYVPPPGQAKDERGLYGTPAPPPIVPMPDPAMQQDARRRAVTQRRAGGGRESTIFSEVGGSTLG